MRVKRHEVRLVVLAILACVMLVVATGCSGGGGSSTEPGVSYQPPHSRPGPASDRIVFSSQGVDQAVSSLRNGKIDLYLFGIKNTAAREIENTTDVTSYRAPAGSVSLILNPAPAREGELNPFSLLKVRRAMNYLVDRNFIANDIYGTLSTGEPLAIPQLSHVSKLDYDYLTVAKVVAEQNIRFDPDKAKRDIAKAMTEAGAELINGKWQYRGKPIVIKFIIRTEDERREVGNAVAANLEQLGFTVQKVLMEFAPAISKVYSSDPQVFDWNIYTEGWGRGAADRYDFASLNSFAAPWMANMPGWGLFGYWQYENTELDETGKRIFTGSFASKEERGQLYQQATGLALQEAVRVWVVTTYNSIPARADLAGVVEDVVAGPKSMLTLREAYVPGQPELRIGNLWVHTERSVWNPVGGFEDVYSIDIWKNIVDPALANDPATGLPRAFRAEFVVEPADPSGEHPVPADAVMWDARKDQWTAVPKGTKATSKVVFDYSKYFQSEWHHGRPITMADVIYSIYSMYERTYDPEKQQIEFVLAATQKPVLDVFRGFRVLDENRLEVYLDYWHFEKAYIASYANIATLSMPWEILAASDDLVFVQRDFAYSKAAAVRYTNGRQLNLVVPENALYVVNILKDYLRTSEIPAFAKSVFQIGGKNYMTVEDATASYTAAITWFDQNNHLVVSNGPFWLKRFDAPAQSAELEAFRSPTYPFKPGDWYQEKPTPVVFANATVDSCGCEVTVELTGPGTLDLHYVVIDPSSGEVQESGVAGEVSPGHFRIELLNAMTERYSGSATGLEIVLLASSDAIALVSESVVPILVP